MESNIGSYICDLIMLSVNADCVIINSGRFEFNLNSLLIFCTYLVRYIVIYFYNNE